MDQIIFIIFFYFISAIAFIFIVGYIRKSLFTYSTIVLGFLSIYALLFAQYLSAPDVDLWVPGEKQALGQFGDFVGGILNPLLTFTTVMILMWNNKQERAEKDLEKKENEALKEQAEIDKIANDKKNKNEQAELKKRYEQEAEKTARQLKIVEDEFHLKQIFEALNAESILFESLMEKEIVLNYSMLHDSLRIKIGEHVTSLTQLIREYKSKGLTSLFARSVNELHGEYMKIGSQVPWSELFESIDNLRSAVAQIDILVLELINHSNSRTICFRWNIRFNKIAMRAAQVGAISIDELDDFHRTANEQFDTKFPLSRKLD